MERLEPYQAFQRIDFDQDGDISPHDLLRFLRQTGFSETHEGECMSIVRYFDNTDRGVLGYNDFL